MRTKYITANRYVSGRENFKCSLGGSFNSISSSMHFKIWSKITIFGFARHTYNKPINGGNYYCVIVTTTK